MNKIIAIILFSLSLCVSANPKHNSKECTEVISGIEEALRDNLEFISSPNSEAANNLLEKLHNDHKVLYVCGTECFLDQPDINRLVSNIGANEFMLATSIERWLNPKYQIIREDIHEETTIIMQSLLMSIESFNKSIQPTPSATAD